jgi:hypothetical protein
MKKYLLLTLGVIALACFTTVGCGSNAADTTGSAAPGSNDVKINQTHHALTSAPNQPFHAVPGQKTGIPK